ncbi:MAG: site-specific integrase [Coriobacteriia bacterium]|nr:site-specific integrase [Coriobacteriia bacterium]
MKCRGAGSIRKRGKKSWEICQPYGRDPLTGKYRRKYRNIKGSKADATRALAELRMEIENGMRLDADTATFGQFAQMWHDARIEANEVGRGSLEQERLYINRLNAIIGDIAIKELDASTIKSALAKIKKRYNLGNTTMLAVHKKCSQIMNEAVLNDYRLSNPMNKLKTPRRDIPNRQPFEKTDLGKLFTALESEGSSDPRVIGVRLAAVLGVRIGEVLGLEWRHIDFEDCGIIIKQSITPYMEIKSTKSGEERLVYLDGDTLQCLKEWQVTQQNILSEWDTEQLATTPIITDQIGNRHDYRNYSRWRKEYLEKVGLSHYVTHETRNTQISYLLDAGVDVKKVQERVGHATSAMTLDVYGRTVSGSGKEVAEVFTSVITEAKESYARKIKENHVPRNRDSKL